MDSQLESGVAVVLHDEADREHFRLLELPADLSGLITSDDPPRLQLKSRDDANGSDKDANVVLCTADKTYNLRQVSTSNSVFIARNGGSGSEIIAKCDSVMETLPSTTGPSAAEDFIRALLPTYSSTGNYTKDRSRSKEALFADIPLSQTECQDGWCRLGCFESVEPPGCFIPSAAVRTRVWEALMTTITASGIDVTDPVPRQDILRVLEEIRGEGPPELLTELITSVSDSAPDDQVLIDQTRLVRAVGSSRLQATSKGRPIETAAFIASWRDAVPEKWRNACELTALQNTYHMQEGGRMVKSLDNSQSSPDATAGGPQNEKVSLGAKRKWHEKFRASKKN